MLNLTAFWSLYCLRDRRPSHRVKYSSVTGTVSEFCGSVVRLVSKFWKTWWALQLFHCKTEILVRVSVFQVEEESVQRHFLLWKDLYVGLCQIPTSTNNARITYTLPAVMCFHFLSVKWKVSGVELLIICGHACLYDVLRDIWVTELLKHIHMSLLVLSFSPRMLQHFCFEPENVPVLCQKNVDASLPLPISSVTPCSSIQEPQLFLCSLSPISWFCSGSNGV